MEEVVLKNKQEQNKTRGRTHSVLSTIPRESTHTDKRRCEGHFPDTHKSLDSCPFNSFFFQLLTMEAKPQKVQRSVFFCLSFCYHLLILFQDQLTTFDHGLIILLHVYKVA